MNRIDEYNQMLQKMDTRWREWMPERVLSDGNGLVLLVKNRSGKKRVIKWCSRRRSERFTHGIWTDHLSFLNEAKVQLALSDCPYVVRCYDAQAMWDMDVGEVNQLMLLEYVGTLTDDMQSRTYTAEDIVKVGTDISYALDALRTLCASHKDMLRQNIFLRREPGGDRYILADFGAVRYWKNGPDEDEIFNMGDVDLRMLGSVLYRMVYYGCEDGRLPYETLSANYQPFAFPVCAPELLCVLHNAYDPKYIEKGLTYKTPAAFRQALKEAMESIHARGGTIGVTPLVPVGVCRSSYEIYSKRGGFVCRQT